MNRLVPRHALVVGVLLGVTVVAAAPPDGPDEGALVSSNANEVGASPDGEPPDPWIEELDDELLLFEALPVVVSSSRQPLPANRTSASTSVLQEDVVRDSGASRVEDLLRLIPGIDVLYHDRDRPAIGVRGSHEYYADRTLALIDGRNVNDPLFGGIDFQRQPLFLEDVQKIEVVRGPGGATWGANAFHGVVNVITKPPAETQGAASSITVNEFGDVLQSARWGDRSGSWAWRVSAGYENRESSSDALTGEDFVSDDTAEEAQVDIRARAALDRSITLDLGIGHSFLRRGQLEFIGVPDPIDPGRFQQTLSTTRAHARWEKELPDGRRGYLQWFVRHHRDDQPGSFEAWSLENTLEGQLDTSWGEGHRTSLGGQFRILNFDTNKKSTGVVGIEGGPRHEEWYGAFLIDRWRATERSILELQTRADHYTESSTDLSGRASWLRFIGPLADERIVRLSFAKSFRTPLSVLRESDLQRLPLPSPPAPLDTYGVNVLVEDDLQNEQIYSVELGYTHPVGSRTIVRANAYWQSYDRLIGVTTLPDPLSLGRLIFQIENAGGAEAFGFEIEAERTTSSIRWSAWYAYNEFEPESREQSIRAFAPARHKVGARATIDVNDAMRCFASYRYVSRTEAPGGAFPDVAEHHLVDLTATWRARENLEWTIGVQDLFDEQRDLLVQFPSTFSVHEIPGRTFFLRASLEF